MIISLVFLQVQIIAKIMSYVISNKVNVGEESIDHSNIEW